jgi:hypothetical protein
MSQAYLAFALRALDDDELVRRIAKLEAVLEGLRSTTTAMGRRLAGEYRAALTAARAEQERRIGSPGRPTK